MSRKIGPIRQLSLQCETPTLQTRRSSLKKQFSEEIVDKKEIPIRISLSAKNRTQHVDRPPPIKLAWGEHNSKTIDEDADVITSKCFEVKPPALKNNRTRDSILYGRQESVKLRQVWQETEKSKQNLNIFLNHNTTDNDNCIESYDTPESENIPKIILPLHIEVQETDLKNIFRKHIRENSRAPVTSSYSPTRTDNPEITSRAEAIVVVPIIERPKPIVPKVQDIQEENIKENIKQENIKTEVIKVENVKEEKKIPSRPATAATKREMFQKRTNSAFHSTLRNDNYRPPLIRASSVPNKPDAKSKFLATKRKLKAKRKEKPPTDDFDKIDPNKKDIITMVSLVSPSGSENEEESDKEAKAESPKTKSKEDKILSAKKTPKTVSFQPSSIHAVKSFSSTFPARRGSMSTAALLGNAAKKLNNIQKVGEKTEKRAPVDDEQIDPKRRLVRSPSVSLEATRKESESTSSAKENTQSQAENLEEKKEELEDPKEKQCWDMYVKMNKRGLTVAYDTILRGMLTPTEYRLRRKIVEQRKSLEMLDSEVVN